MLVDLVVRDLGVIEEAHLALGPGMTAVTGETGAGKTLLVGALALLLGGRGEATMVRPGAEEAVIEARFVDDTDTGTDTGTGTETTLARSVGANGRSRAWVDGRAVPVSQLAEVGAGLVELHGQHAHRALVESAAQRQALDRFAGIDLAPLRRARAQVRDVERALAALGGDPAERRRQLDRLRFEHREIEDAAIAGADEDEALAVEEERLGALAAHREAAQAALAAIDGDGVVGGAREAVAIARQLVDGRAGLTELAGRLGGLQAELEDTAAELRRVVETWEDDPEALDAVRRRRHLLRQLSRKYGGDLAAVLAHRDEVGRMIEEMTSAEADAAHLERQLTVLREEVAAAESAVAEARRQAAPELAARVEGHLRGLAMPHARVDVEVDGDGPADEVVFCLRANPGAPALPLAKVASGGELARTMLALRLVLSSGPPTMVFDEVDAGIGGEAALAVGRALADLAVDRQVLVVTHLPQVAAHADRQLSVAKVVTGGRTTSVVTPVDGADREVELARMLSGQPDSVTARRHAAELLAAARRSSSGPAAAMARRSPVRPGRG
jgi:DNA repair protein RecN (Recombination protein N)